MFYEEDELDYLAVPNINRPGVFLNQQSRLKFDEADFLLTEKGVFLKMGGRLRFKLRSFLMNATTGYTVHRFYCQQNPKICTIFPEIRDFSSTR